LQVRTLEVFQDNDPDSLLEQARETAKYINDGGGLLVLTDIYGSTPSNIANRLADNNQVEVISGINLPMLIRALNYPNLDLKQLTEKALSGGRDGIVRCTQETTE
jgi:PTS system ascorbate-specific IIA component